MGNAAAKEGENGHGGPMEESDRDAVVPSGPQLAVGQMACSPPESPRNSQSPRMSAPQVFGHPSQLGSPLSPAFSFW
ncbi:hypothetical protein BHE74_00037473 [Ensete ventricosum]|nr:hypothetical protein GW17_00058439 [Ensete ventricosum]RWW55854.1 hypothetical protein BHE74_00037473 [Ensete ventricosum]RZR93197.1 hypothetical protein BHM03_00021633 [Ensete ventricosum]